MSAEANDSQPSTGQPLQKRKLNRVIDMTINRSIGNISSVEFKRRTILNEINHLCYASDKTVNGTVPINMPYSHTAGLLTANNRMPDEICYMECDPKEGRCLLVALSCNDVHLYSASKDIGMFDQVVQLRDTCNFSRYPFSVPHSVHWLSDGIIFSIGTRDSVNFWDSSTFTCVETIKFPNTALNHVIAANIRSRNKYVAVAGFDGIISLIDMRYGVISMTIPSVETSPIRAIQWHPAKELQYVTGSDSGNMFLWDFRFHKKYLRKFNNNDSFASAKSHSQSITGLHFYQNGNSIISVDFKGCIKTWNTNTGARYPTHYEPISYSQNTRLENYQFATTGNLMQDVVFLPTDKGLRMFDIDSGEHLLHSNDISLPLRCVTYDPLHMHVYCGFNNEIKVWTRDRTNLDLIR